MCSHIHVHGAIAVQLGWRIVVRPGARNVAILVGPTVHVPREAQPHLAVDHVGRGMACCLLVEPWEEQVPGCIWVSMWPCETSGGKQTVLRPGGIPKTPISEEKVPGGVESRRGVRANVGRVVMVSQGSCCVAGRLGRKRRLSGANIVGAVVYFEGAHPIRERIYPQRYFSLCDFACWVMPWGAESSDSYGGILRSCVQEHLQSRLAETTESRNQKTTRRYSSSPSLYLLDLYTEQTLKSTEFLFTF